MISQPIRVTRLYLTEADHQIKTIMHYLHDQEKVAGVTVYRGIQGFGNSGEIHQSTLLDLSFDLPLIIEFHDESEKALEVIKHLKENFKNHKIVSWIAEQF
jgi:PII-like signaling protein